MSFDFLSPELIQEIAQRYGYWAIFLGILLENLGLPVPGETVTLAGGFLAGSDQLKYWFVLGSAIGGAILGGGLGYWIGRYGGMALLLKASQLLRVDTAQLETLKGQFSANAGKAVFVGRFIALLRVFASPLAGIVEMPFATFMLYNSLGAIVWAGVMVTLAFFAGHLVPLERLIALVSQFGAVAFLIALGWIVVPFWLESRKAKQGVVPVQQPAGDAE